MIMGGRIILMEILVDLPFRRVISFIKKKSNGQHYAIVHEVNDNGYITFGEVLGGLNCLIFWGGFEGSSSPTYIDNIKSIATYIVKAAQKLVRWKCTN